MFVDQIISRIVTEEGGYIKNPHALGGRTNFGITETAWKEYIERGKFSKKPEDIRDISITDANAFYNDRLIRTRITELPFALRYPVADFEVNAGRNAITILQSVINRELLSSTSRKLTLDGILGDKTFGAIYDAIDGDFDRSHVINRLADCYVVRRIYYYIDLAERKPEQAVFLRGWIARAEQTFSYKDTAQRIHSSPKAEE